MGRKVQSTSTISIEQFRTSIRLRWTYCGERFTLTVGKFNKENIRLAEKIKAAIEEDIDKGKFDITRRRYKNIINGSNNSAQVGNPEKAVIKTKLESLDINTSKTGKHPREKYRLPPENKNSQLFQKWLDKTGQYPVPVNLPKIQKLLRRYGDISLELVVEKFKKHGFSSRTYNVYLNIFRRFYKWLHKNGHIEQNYFDEVVNMRQSGANRKNNRQPFSDDEIKAILQAFKNDTFCKSKTYLHSGYFPLMYFYFSTGVRVGEAVGLLIDRVLFDQRVVRIDQSFSPTEKGCNVSARILKGTKTENSRDIPLDDELYDLLKKCCAGRNENDFVFVTRNGNPIDPRMFQKRVFKPILKNLGIPERDLTAARHTFGTAIVEQKINLLDGAYYMGHSTPNTMLTRYVHLREKPKTLPKIVKR